jgi:uncharacterized membrane protein YdbT with pleckstrin-like domain
LVPIYVRFFWRLLVRANEEYIITNMRVVKQQGVLSKYSFDASLEKINNIFHSQSFLGRIGNYGDVGLETASEQGTTLFRYIPHPVAFKNTIIAQQQSARGRTMSMSVPVAAAPSPVPQDIPALLQQLQQLREQGIITQEEFDSKKQELLSRL